MYVYKLKQQPTENDEDSWVSSREICDFLKISERTLQRLRTNGKISYTNLGGKSIITRSVRLKNC